MSRNFKIILLICVVLMQLTILAHFTPFNIIPNYMVVVLIAVSLICPDKESMIVSGFIGALADVLGGTPFGVNLLLSIYLSIGCVFISQAVYNTRVKVFAPVCFVLSFVYELLLGIFSCLLRNTAFSYDLLINIVLPVAFINTIIFIPIYEVLKRVRIEKKRKGIKYEQ